MEISNVEETNCQNPHEEMKKWMFYPHERLEALRLFFEAGVIPALYDALTLVYDAVVPAPEWVIEGAIEIVKERIVSGKSHGPGPTGNEIGKYKQDMKHFRRWQMVKKAKQEGLTWDGAYCKASTQLCGTFAFCSPSAAKQSYLRVEKDMKTPNEALKYYTAMRDTPSLTNTTLSTGSKIPI